MTDKKLKEDISVEADLLLKLRPLPEADIFEFMKNLRGGTYFNMGMFRAIPVARAYKKTIRIYKVEDLAAIVSGVSYENIGTTKDFRAATGKDPGKAWYDHMPGYENKIGVKKSDTSSKYVLWDVKRCTDTCIRYYVVDIDTGAVQPVSKKEIENSAYLTATEKAKLEPRQVTAFDLNTGDLVENKTVWRTAAFDHIFWLSQNGATTREYGTRFAEALELSEALDDEIFRDANAHVKTKLDDILSGGITETLDDRLDDRLDDDEEIEIDIEDLTESSDSNLFIDKHENIKTDLDDILSGGMDESLTNGLTESYRRTVSRGNSLVNNELFIDFD